MLFSMTKVLHVAKFCSTDLLTTMSSCWTHLDHGLGTAGDKTQALLKPGRAGCGGAGSFVE